ncbi:MAG: iron ABC transporter permease [Anaerolineales bacterium]|nr:iron ABC transporter permease [Anaerolineales bacterium]
MPRLGPAARTAALWAAPLVYLALFYALPMAHVLSLSLARGAGLAAPFVEAFTSPVQRHILGFTLLQAGLSTLLTLLIGLPGAYLLGRFEFRGRSLIQALTVVPFVMPTLVVGAAFQALLGPRGWANLALMGVFGLSEPPLHIVHTLGAILLAHVFYNTSIVLRLVGDFWSHLDPRLGAAARTLGAGRGQVLRRVTLPLLMPAIAAAALLVFLFDFTSFGVILILGGPRLTTLEVEIYNQTVGLFNLPLAAALSILQLGCTLALTFAYTRLAARLSRPISLRSRRHTQLRLHGLRRRLGAAALVGLLLLLLTTPLLALAARSVVRLDLVPGQTTPVYAGPTLEFYRELWVNRQGSVFYVPPTTAIGVSLAYAAASVVLSLALGLPAAWALAYRPASTASRLFDPLLLLPLGTSAVTLGLGFIVALNRPPLDLRASPLLVPLAHTLVALPFVVRSLTPALRSIRPRLRQAASVLGASPARVVARVDLPLVGRALLVAAAFAFTISLGEFGATALIARPEYPTVPLMIYRFLSLPGALNYGQGLALSTILMLVCAAGMLGIERLRIAEIGEF